MKRMYGEEVWPGKAEFLATVGWADAAPWAGDVYRDSGGRARVVLAKSRGFVEWSRPGGKPRRSSWLRWRRWQKSAWRATP
jgi:hypothetical protein